MIDLSTGDGLAHASPLETFQAYARDGHLAYQVTPQGAAVFFPRVAAPGSGLPLRWKISQGLGTVYATTVIHAKDQAPYNLALIDLDEGFRMMSQVQGVLPTSVCIGLRVKVWMQQDADGVHRPYFKPLQEAAP